MSRGNPWRACIVLAGLCWAVGSAAADDREAFERDVMLGTNALSAGDLAQARSYLERAAKAFPADPLPRIGLGLVYLHAGADWSAQATREFGAGGGWPEALVGLGYAALAAGDYPVADLFLADAARVAGDAMPNLTPLRAYVALCALDGTACSALLRAARASSADSVFVDAIEAERSAWVSDTGPARQAASRALAALEARMQPDVGAVRLNAPRAVHGGASALPKWAAAGRADAARGPLIAYPGEGASVAGRVAIHVIVPPGVGGARPYVTVAVDGKPIAASDRAPYRFDWDSTRVPPGTHVVSATVREAPTSTRAVSAQQACTVLSQPVRPEWGQTYRSAAARLRALLVEPRMDESWVSALQALTRGSTDVLPTRDTPRMRPIRTRSGLTRDIRPAPVAGPRVALFFDDGPHPTITPMILELLRSAGVKASFFLVGRQCEAYPSLVRKIRDEGHTVGSHSYSHANLTNLYAVEIEREVAGSAQLISNILSDGQTGTPSRVRFFRCPGGNVNTAVQQAIRRAGLIAMDDGLYNTWGTMDRTPEEIVAAALQSPHEVILLHNGIDKTVFVLPLLISALKTRGVTFVTADELVQGR